MNNIKGHGPADEKMPPAWARKLLRWRCALNLLEEIEGDLLEEYLYQVRIHGERKARWDYALNVITYIHPFRLKRKSNYPASSSINIIMWKNYLTTAIRNFSRNKTYSVLNLAGLTLGLMCSMLIFQYVIFEREADSFHKKGDHLYRVAFRLVAGGGSPETITQIFFGAADAFEKEIPAVENVVRIRADFFQEGPTMTYTTDNEKTAIKDVRSIIVDSTFLDLFTFPLVTGDVRKALRSPAAILITESMARRLFGSNDPIGKTLDYSMNQGTQSLTVTGVVKDVPANSHIQFDVVIPLQTHMESIPVGIRQYYSPWEYKEFTTYVALLPEADISDTEAMMTTVVGDKIGENLKRANIALQVKLQPMSSLYFDRQSDLGLTGFGSALVSTRTGNKQMIYFFSVIAVITLMIALMSYINLSTVRSLDRAKEIGVRKVVGAYRSHLRMQFFMESVLMNFSALSLAVLFVMLLTPSFNLFVQTDFTMASWLNEKFLLVFGSVFVMGVLLSSLYPAFVLSSFKPISALKGTVNSITSRSQLRKFFVVLQYAPAIGLIVCTMVVYAQVDFMRTMDIGLNMHKLITIRSPRLLPDGVDSRDAEASFKGELRGLTIVAGASYAGNQAGRGLNFLVPFQADSTEGSGLINFKGSGVDQDFPEVYGLTVVSGEPFKEGMPATFGNPEDFTRRVLVNETAVRKWGFQKNSDAVGRVVSSANGSRYYVQAVLEDFNWSSVQHATDPVILWFTPNNRFMTVRLTPEADIKDGLAQIKNIYDRLFPLDVFHYEFAEEVYNKQYGEDEKFARLFGIFSGMAILIATLGLFGLSAFAAERRMREVGIRKIMGANVIQIINLLGKEFVLLVAIAFLLASPAAYFLMHRWLEGFAFRTDLGLLPFIITAAGSILIAGITVSMKAIHVARTNPVNTLRSE